MRWPYNERANPIHAWGTIAAGIAIAGALYTARALNPHAARSWGWPTNWMLVPVIIVGVGLILLAVPVRRSHRERERATRRQVFARGIEDQLRLLSSGDDWNDEQYAELEAYLHVEADLGPELRREPSLTEALLDLRHQLIVLEGEPGSGKSVTMRHLGLRLANQAQQSTAGANSLLPLYVDLKNFRPSRRPVDSESVHEFIRESLNPVNDRDVRRYLADEFDEGLRTGGWLLLFDSFDEIPDLLGATESDAVVSEYTKALIAFVRNRSCRAVIASREFRGPSAIPLPRLRLAPLTDQQKHALVERSRLPKPLINSIASDIARAEPELQQLASNPQFLWLLCEYRRNGGRFPAGSHDALESYVEHRLANDADRIRERFGFSTALLRLYAQELAFIMTASPAMGLSATSEQLVTAIAQEARLAPRRIADALNALEYAKLGRIEIDPIVPETFRFSFIRRRFQDYFATCAVLREASRVSPETLLTNGRWRETAAAMLQILTEDAAGPLLQTTRDRLRLMVDQISDRAPRAAGEPFNWPPSLLYLLEVLTAAHSLTPWLIPADIRIPAGQALKQAWQLGRRHDRIWVIDLVLIAPDPVKVALLDDAINSPSPLLKEAAYQQMVRAGTLPQLPQRASPDKGFVLPFIKATFRALGCIGGVAVMIACFGFWGFVTWAVLQHHPRPWVVVLIIVFWAFGIFSYWPFLKIAQNAKEDRVASERATNYAHEILRRARRRSQPYSPADIRVLCGAGTAGEIRQMCRTLRLTPQLCQPNVIDLLSDMATAAEKGGHRRYRREFNTYIIKPPNRDRIWMSRSGTYIPEISAKVAVPQDASSAFIQWSKKDADELAGVLLNMDPGTIDEVAMLVAVLRKVNASTQNSA